MDILASENDDNRAGPTEVPRSLAARDLPTEPKRVLFKRRAESVTSMTGRLQKNKKQKKEHKKSMSQEEADDYIVASESESSGSQVATLQKQRQTTESSESSAQRPARKLILHGPRAKPDGAGERCIVCARPKQSSRSRPCSKCGRRKFCSNACKKDFKEEFCCKECRDEHGSSSDFSSSESDDETSNANAVCLLCGQSRTRIFAYGFSCRHCGERQFCTETCREGYGEAHCSPICAEAAEKASEDEEDDNNECVICGDKIDSSTGRAVPCHHCSSMKYCSLDCKDAMGDEFKGHCSATCLRFMGENAEKNASKSKKKPDTKAPEGELSILADPRNYEQLTDDVERADVSMDASKEKSSTLDDLPAFIISHDLTDNSRKLQYRLETTKPRTRRWQEASTLKGAIWTTKMRSYWSQDTVSLQREALEHATFTHKPLAFGRFVLKLEIEDHRALLFETLDYTGRKNTGGQTYWEYGETLGAG